MREAQLQFSAAVYVENQDVDISRKTINDMWKNWVAADDKFNESFKKESKMTLPKTHNKYTESMVEKSLTDRSYFEHSVQGKYIHESRENLIERENSLIEAYEWLKCVFGLLNENMYYLI